MIRLLARFVAAATAFILQGAGVDVARYGTTLYCKGRIIEVVEGCSGIRSLRTITACVALCTLLGWLDRSRLLCLMCVGIVAAVVCNVIRCCVTVLWPHSHDVAGYLAFGGTLAAVLGVDALLDKRQNRNGGDNGKPR